MKTRFIKIEIEKKTTKTNKLCLSPNKMTGLTSEPPSSANPPEAPEPPEPPRRRIHRRLGTRTKRILDDVNDLNTQVRNGLLLNVLHFGPYSGSDRIGTWTAKITAAAGSLYEGQYTLSVRLFAFGT